MFDTSDEWIRQRTGIRERHILDREAGETVETLATNSLANALEASQVPATDLDLVICGTCTNHMSCPSAACRVATNVGATNAAAFDLVAACSGFLYSLNLADTLIRQGRHKSIGVIGADAMSSILDYEDRSVSILFGDAGGAAVLTRDENPERGCLYQSMGADAANWDCLYLPRHVKDIPDWDKDNPIKLGCLRMTGREVFKFAVKKFQEVIDDALEQTGIDINDVAQLVCHQSNIRIIDAARERLGLDKDRVYTNIDRIGNTSAGSIGLCLDELTRAGKIKTGDLVLFAAFGGGLTWASSVWRV
jgi:3-oxoacyl-[acyl-carrier-protein] synthase-3